MLQWTAGHTLGEEMKRLEQSDRLVIEGGAAELQSEVTIVDRSTIRDVLALFERYPRGWIIISGAPGDYLLNFYRGDNVLQVLGLSHGSPRSAFEDTLSFGSYFRRAPASDVAPLARRLGLPWPPNLKRKQNAIPRP